MVTTQSDVRVLLPQLYASPELNGIPLIRPGLQVSPYDAGHLADGLADRGGSSVRTLTIHTLSQHYAGGTWAIIARAGDESDADGVTALVN